MIKASTITRSMNPVEVRAKIKELLAQIAILQAELDAIQSSRDKIYKAALAALGTDASPSDLAPDELGCAETVNAIVKKALGYEVGGTLSTNLMYKALLTSSKFIKVDQALPGDIIISPTGYGNGKLSNGHVAIAGENDTIMSNSSATGTFESNYTQKTWDARYVTKGGYPKAFFRAI